MAPVNYVLQREKKLDFLGRDRKRLGLASHRHKLKFNPCGEFRWSPEGPVSQIHSPDLHVGASGIFSDLLRSVQMLKREWDAESNGKLPHLFIPNKTATLVPGFAMEDLPLGRTAVLVPEFAVKHLPLSRTLWWWHYLRTFLYRNCAIFYVYIVLLVT